VSKRKASPYRSGRSPDWLKMKNSDAPAVKRETEEDWSKERWRMELPVPWVTARLVKAEPSAQNEAAPKTVFSRVFGVGAKT
jgi:hypothetical protein